jgi:hypothetical protein
VHREIEGGSSRSGASQSEKSFSYKSPQQVNGGRTKCCNISRTGELIISNLLKIMSTTCSLDLSAEGLAVAILVLLLVQDGSGAKSYRGVWKR